MFNNKIFHKPFRECTNKNVKSENLNLALHLGVTLLSKRWLQWDGSLRS